MIYLRYKVHSLYTCYITLYNIKESNATMNITNIFSNINPKEVIKNLPDAVFVVDFDGKIMWANEKASIIFESQINQLKGLVFDEIVVNGLELAEQSYSRRSSVVTGAFSANGKEFFVEINARKYIEQYFITIRDITTMTNVLAAAEQTGRLNKENNIMLTRLSNEIKSPLQSIIGFSQALIDGLGGEINEKQDKYVRIINKNSAELLYFMDKLIEFSQAESSLMNISKHPFDLINTIQTIVKNNESQLNAKKLVINYNFDDFNKKTVYSNENAVRIVLQNILETSIKLTESGSISIKVDHPELEITEKLAENKDSTAFVRITFTDTGIGFAESELDDLFEPYSHLEKINKKTIARSITLGTVSTLVKRLGGIIWVNSEVMKGSSFFVILPVEK